MQTYVQLELCHPNQHGDSHLLRIGSARHHFGRCEQECTEQRRDHLAINGEYGDYTIATSATYFCGCSNLNLGVGSGRVVPVPPPNYTVNLVQDSGTYIFTTNPLRHRKDVWYQLF